MNDHYTPGWIDDPEAVAGIVDTLPEADAALTPISEMHEVPASAYLWDIARKVLGNLLPPRNQGSVGSCVAFATVRAIEYTMLAEIAAGDPEMFASLAPEPVYAGSRVEVGKGKLGNHDGSIGAWAATFVRDWGILPQQILGEHDLTTYSEARCRRWGKDGCPDDLEQLSRSHPVRSVTRVSTWTTAKQALANGYGIAVCSNQGFKMVRNEIGECRASGSWAHAMCLSGYTTLADGRELGRLDNSWGPDAHTGPVGPGDPGPEGFWADSSVIGSMLAKGDAWIFATVEGFPRRTIPWLI